MVVSITIAYNILRIWRVSLFATTEEGLIDLEFILRELE